MAVQAQHLLSHPFLPHDLGHAFRALDGAAVVAGAGAGVIGAAGSVFLDELGIGGCAAPAVVGGAAFADAPPRSELTCNGGGDNAGYGFLPRKRARVAAAAGLLEDAAQQGVVLPMAALPPLGQVVAGDVQSRAVGCGAAAASTSGRAAVGGVMSQLYHQGAEIDALVRLETERMRVGLLEARRRHARAVVVAVERAAAGRLRAAEAELERARCRNAELEERLRQLAAEGQAWLGVARSHEAVAAGLRATLDQLLLQQQPNAASAACALLPAGCGVDDGGEGDAEDAQSCCFETPAPSVADAAAASSRRSSPLCRYCGGGEACVLLLPCRHLCLCRACEPAAGACPVCAATKNASLQVLLS